MLACVACSSAATTVAVRRRRGPAFGANATPVREGPWRCTATPGLRGEPALGQFLASCSGDQSCAVRRPGYAVRYRPPRVHRPGLRCQSGPDSMYEGSAGCVWSACTGSAKECATFSVAACPVSPAGAASSIRVRGWAIDTATSHRLGRTRARHTCDEVDQAVRAKRCVDRDVAAFGFNEAASPPQGSGDRRDNTTATVERIDGTICSASA